MKNVKHLIMAAIGGLIIIGAYMFVYYDYGNNSFISKLIFNLISDNTGARTNHLLFVGKKMPIKIVYSFDCNEEYYLMHYQNKSAFYLIERKEDYARYYDSKMHYRLNGIINSADIKLLDKYTAAVVYNGSLQEIYYEYYGYDNVSHYGHILLDESKKYRNLCKVYFFKEKAHIFFDPV